MKSKLEADTPIERPKPQSKMGAFAHSSEGMLANSIPDVVHKDQLKIKERLDPPRFAGRGPSRSS